MQLTALTIVVLCGFLALAQDPSGFNGKPFFLIELTPVRGLAAANSPTNAEQMFLGEHAAYLHKLRADKILLVAGRSTTDRDAVELILVQVPSADTAQRILSDDPAVKGRVFKGDVRPFQLESYR